MTDPGCPVIQSNLSIAWVPSEYVHPPSFTLKTDNFSFNKLLFLEHRVIAEFRRRSKHDILSPALLLGTEHLFGCPAY